MPYNVQKTLNWTVSLWQRLLLLYRSVNGPEGLGESGGPYTLPLSIVAIPSLPTPSGPLYTHCRHQQHRQPGLPRGSFWGLLFQAGGGTAQRTDRCVYLLLYVCIHVLWKLYRRSNISCLWFKPNLLCQVVILGNLLVWLQLFSNDVPKIRVCFSIYMYKWW